MRIMFQGRNGMKPGDPDYEAAKKLGELLAEQGHEAIVGAYGGVVSALLESGIRCHGHLSNRRLEEVPEGLELVDCQELALVKLGYSEPEIAWGLRLGLMMKADAFVFFRGGAGTLAHLVPALTQNIKRWGPQGKHRKVAMVGWEADELTALGKLYQYPTMWASSWWTDRPFGWAHLFEPQEMRDVVDFLTAGN